MLNLPEIAKGFSAIGSEQRLHVYLTLIQHSPKKLTIKEIQELVNIKPSTLAHHIKILVDSHMIIQEKNGKETLNYANLEALTDLCDAIQRECCASQS